MGNSRRPPPVRRAPAERSGPPRSTSRRPPPVPERRGALDWVAEAFDGHGHDVWGLILVALGIVGGFGVYAHSAGPVGRGLAALLGAFLGMLRYLAPLGLVAVGVLLIRGPRPTPTDVPFDQDAQPSNRTAKIALGVGLLVGAVAGLFHLAVDPPSVTDGGLDTFAPAGGFLGALVAGPVAALLSPWGALPVLLLVALLGVSLVSGRSLLALGRMAVAGLRPAVAAGGRWLGDLFKVGADEDGEVVEGGGPTDPTVPLFDQDSGTEGLPAPRRRRRKPPEPTLVLPPDPAAEATQLEIDLAPAVGDSPWRLPGPRLLARSGAQEIDSDAVTARGRVLEAALAEHGVSTRLVGMVVGPTVTRYELELGVGVKVNAVTSLSKDIAYAMASPDVRIIAPIPGKQAIGVEVPNDRRQVVRLGDILGSEEAQRATHPLEVGIGRDIDGKAVLANLATMPHILIAGQTGAGKSSCINSIITSIMMRATPDLVRMILIDPKRVELTQYNRIPHLLTQVVTNPKKAANALAWAVKEMERRYDLLSGVGVRDITGYNAAYDRGDLVADLGEEVEYQRLPFVLVVVDELADLMMVAARDVEDSVCRLAQMARAVGIHLVIATQRPSVNVITGVIKANIPARLAFAVASATDSKVILDQAGAERLVGRGDMLLLGGSSSAPQRIQGSWVEEKEVHAVVSQWRRQAPEMTFADSEVQGNDEGVDGSLGGGSGSPGSGEDDDDLLWQAMELVVRSQLGSTSMLQRKLKVGFARAGRLMDLLEEKGVVGPSEGSKARAVLMTVEELEALTSTG